MLASRMGLRVCQAGITTNKKLRKIERKMARTKQVQRKKTQNVARVTQADTTVQSLPLPKGIKEEGELLYRQYFMLYGLSPELRGHLKITLNWTEKQVTAHMKYREGAGTARLGDQARIDLNFSFYSFL